MKSNLPLIALGAVTAAGGVAFAMRRGRNQLSLRGMTVLITGGSRGLGLQLARDLADEGCRIAICARDGAELDRAARDLRSHGADVATYVCDVTDEAAVKRLIADVEEDFGNIDILVNNAGTMAVGPVEQMRVEDFDAAMRVMFWGTVYTTLGVLPSMIARKKGSVVNITSIGAKVGVPHLAPYCAAKFAAAGFSEAIAAELRPKGINVMTVAPGLMRTGSYVQAQFKGQQEKEYRWFSLGATMPGLSMNAQRASRSIVNAIRRRRSQCIVSAPANLLSRMHGVFPGITTSLVALAGRLLPASGGGNELVRGKNIESESLFSLHRWMTSLGRQAGSGLNQA